MGMRLPVNLLDCTIKKGKCDYICIYFLYIPLQQAIDFYFAIVQILDQRIQMNG